MSRVTRWRTAMLSLACLGVLLGIQVAVATPAAAGWRDVVDSMEVDYEIRADGSMRVTQTIEYRFGADQRPGIELDLLRREPWDTDRDAVYTISDITASSPTGAATDVTTRQVDDGDEGKLRVRIGDPAQPADLAETYVVGYTVDGATQAQPSYDEFVWDVSGRGLDAPVSSVRATVRAPGGAQSVRCSLDPEEDVPCGLAQTQGDGQAMFAARNLDSDQGMFIAVMLIPGAVENAGPDLIERPEPVTRSLFYGGLGMVATTAAMMVLALVVRQRLANRAPVSAPRLLAPDDEVDLTRPEVPPAEAALLVDGVLEPRHTAATLMDMAVRGALSVGPAVAGEATLTLRDPKLVRAGYERSLALGLFRELTPDTTVTVGPRRPIQELHAALCRAVSSTVTERRWFPPRPRVFTGWATFGLLSLLAVVTTMAGISIPGLTASLPGWPLVALLTLIPVVVGGIWLAKWRWWPRHTPTGAATAATVREYRDRLAALEANQVTTGSSTLAEALPWSVSVDDTERWASVTEEATTLGRIPDEVPAWWRGTTFSPFAVVRVVRALELAAAGGPLTQVPGPVRVHT